MRPGGLSHPTLILLRENGGSIRPEKELSTCGIAIPRNQLEDHDTMSANMDGSAHRTA
ncbi:hypothetical protein OG21DRAFT_1510835 [Imleria badia]|nr:hypothetical protein OG21DRAFT_1510835 [Imleria badia]